MIKELKLSDDQVKKFKDMQVEARKALRDLYDSKDASKSKKFAQLREETREKILAQLNADQKAKVRELAGASFEGEIEIEDPPPEKDK
jgi:hypothetical protein